MRSSFVAAIVAAALVSSALADLSQPGPFLAGTRTVTVPRPNGTTFNATLYYPATSAANNAPFDASGAPYPGITFGHGFVQPVSQYASTMKHLASYGFLVIASQSEGSLFPSHASFANDMRSCLDWLEAQNVDPASPYLGAVETTRFGASGHSMGGGCAILATKDDPRIDAVAPLAAADTNPSAIAAMLDVEVPSRLIAGSQDGIVATATSSALMYANADAPKQLQVIQGGFHCGFTDADFLFCDSGSITRAAQLAITRRLLTEFFLLHLKGDQSPWASGVGHGENRRRARPSRRATPAAPCSSPMPLAGIAGVPASATDHGDQHRPARHVVHARPERMSPRWSISLMPATTPVPAPGRSARGGARGHGRSTPMASLLVTATRSRRRAHMRASRNSISASRDADAGPQRRRHRRRADLGVLLAAWGARPVGGRSAGTASSTAPDTGILLAAWD
ncbi:MAG: dienelactone hydrolase family protein [Phycisphaerales bacterium]